MKELVETIKDLLKGAVGVILGTILYIAFYVANEWFPFNLLGFGIFTLAFVLGYFIIWLSIYLSIKNSANKLNKKINN